MTIHQSITDELRCMADVLDETDDNAYGDDSASRRIDAGYLRSAADKLESGSLLLSENERQVVEDELFNWDTKDCWSERGPQRRLQEAQAALGMLDRYDPEAYYSSRPKTRTIADVRYIVG